MVEDKMTSIADFIWEAMKTCLLSCCQSCSVLVLLFWYGIKINLHIKVGNWCFWHIDLIEGMATKPYKQRVSFVFATSNWKHKILFPIYRCPVMYVFLSIRCHKSYDNLCRRYEMWLSRILKSFSITCLQYLRLIH